MHCVNESQPVKLFFTRVRKEPLITTPQLKIFASDLYSHILYHQNKNCTCLSNEIFKHAKIIQLLNKTKFLSKHTTERITWHRITRFQFFITVHKCYLIVVEAKWFCCHGFCILADEGMTWPFLDRLVGFFFKLDLLLLF